MPQGASSASLKNEHSPPQGCALGGEAREISCFSEKKAEDLTPFWANNVHISRKAGCAVQNFVISQAGLLFYTAFVGAQ